MELLVAAFNIAQLSVELSSTFIAIFFRLESLVHN